MHDDRQLTEDRIPRFLREHLIPAIHRETAAVTATAYQVPGEPIPPREAIGQQYQPISVGERWGRAWSTMWLHVTGTVPAEWGDDDTSDCELVLDLSFDDKPGFQSEALAFTADGVPLKGINPYNRYLPLTPGQQLDLYLECAANPVISGGWNFAPTPLGHPDTAGDDLLYQLRALHLVRRDRRIQELCEDFRALDGLMLQLPQTSHRRHQILRALERALDLADPDDLPGTVEAAREALRPALSSPAGGSAMTVMATGHAHIDSAWLWPVRETIRKCARTFSSACSLIDTDPDFLFSASSAQQYRWMRDRYPELFERIRQHVAAGRFVPVGGMWVESDTNLPGSEAMARQFVAGKRFFLDHFGIETTETWLPDSFGYSAALPQIAALAGQPYFLTQKVSWNQFNSFPHHTFRWEGIDGTRVFTHFPPADTYNGDLSAAELAYLERNFKEKGRASAGIDLFGWGDGGGGPTREMMAAGRRAADLEGSPKVEFAPAHEFFRRAHQEYPDAPVWAGELYLELHRGTYSAQLATKQGNRRSEHLLHEAEFLSALAAIRAGFDYPYEELEAIWEDTLLNQFHDILPGSSIAWVHRDAERNYAAIRDRTEAIIGAALRALGGTAELGVQEADDPAADGVATTVLLNTAPVSRRGIPAYGAAVASTPAEGVVVIREGAAVRLDNGRVRAELDETGALTSLVDADTGRDSIAPGAKGALLQLHRDSPNAWDAWDIDEFYRHAVRDLDAPTSVDVSEDQEGGGARVSFTYTTDAAPGETTDGVTGAGSRVVKTFVLRPAQGSLEISLDLDWQERKKALKLAFPLDVRAASMSSEIQFGHIDRPVPVNTLWDFARFETCAHRWVRLAEPGYGVAIANDSTYGHDVLRAVREDGGTTTTARLTLVRGPEYPDPTADHGRYTVRVAIAPGATVLDAVAEGYRLNLPERPVSQDIARIASRPLVRVDAANVLIETVKLAEDRSGDLVVRLYEAEGARAQATVSVDAGASHAGTGSGPGPVSGPAPGRVQAVDLLERPFPADAPAYRSALEDTEDGIRLSLRPFEIKTLRIARRG